jgi:hypothetical protein
MSKQTFNTHDSMSEMRGRGQHGMEWNAMTSMREPVTERITITAPGRGTRALHSAKCITRAVCYAECISSKWSGGILRNLVDTQHTRAVSRLLLFRENFYPFVFVLIFPSLFSISSEIAPFMQFLKNF